MGPVDAFWQLANFFAPAFGLGVIAAAATKLLWRASLKTVSWWRLARWAIGCSSLVLTSGLVVFGRDGKMATYGAMILVCALTLWWFGFVRRGR